MTTTGDLDELWDRLDKEGASLKDSHYSTAKLRRFVKGLRGIEREEAESVLADWIFSGDPKRRFDALATIEDLELRSAVPALRRLSAEFEESSSPSAPYDWAWVNRIIARLTSVPEP
jgi:hypothetical protein